MKSDECCQDMIVVHKRRRRIPPRVTERDFEVLREMMAEVEKIGVENEEIRKRLNLE